MDWRVTEMKKKGQQIVYSGSDLKAIGFKSVYILGVAMVLTILNKFLGVWVFFSYFFHLRLLWFSVFCDPKKCRISKLEQQTWKKPTCPFHNMNIFITFGQTRIYYVLWFSLVEHWMLSQKQRWRKTLWQKIRRLAKIHGVLKQV